MDNKPQNLTTEEKSIVAAIRCENYQPLNVKEAVRAAMEHLGGIEKFVKPGDKVHIKPNLLTAKPPEKAATTHPEVVRAIGHLLRDLGAVITIGDSPAGVSRPIEEYWNITGIGGVAKELGAQLIRFEKNDVVERKVGGSSYFVAKSIIEADVVINACKLKTHSLVLYTGALKNMFGAIPGFRKSEYHKQAPKAKSFSKIIVDVFEATRPQISLMDAIVAMEGNGPSSGNPKKLGLVLASEDAVALDAVASELIGFEDGEINAIDIAFQRGLGEKRKEKIVVFGDELESFDNPDFVLPSNRFLNYVPSSLVRLVGSLLWVRPEPIDDKCRRCGACIANCPTQAMIPDKDGFPVINYDKCISCFCCDEICPFDAIDQDISRFAKIFR